MAIKVQREKSKLPARNHRVERVHIAMRDVMGVGNLNFPICRRKCPVSILFVIAERKNGIPMKNEIMIFFAVVFYIVDIGNTIFQENHLFLWWASVAGKTKT